MIYNVNIMATAKHDIKKSVEYIAQTLGNETAAKRLFEKAYASARSLAENPLRQPLVRDRFLGAKGLRLLSVNKYNLFYTVCETTKSVSIIRFIHSRRDWTNFFNDRDFESYQ